MKKKIVIFGSTGSIGKIFLKIVKKDLNNNEILLLTVNKNINLLLKQLKVFKVKNVIIKDKKNFLIIKEKFKNMKINIYNNFDQIDTILKRKRIDYTLNAISGLDGLEPTLKIIKHTKKIAIANKESIICGWSLIKNELTKYKTEFVPIDSEHFSIWSLINKTDNANIEKVFITASGGPFRNYPLNKFKFITKEMALNHPNWVMGKKISIDSATMMNKVFEIIEAQKIFNLNYDQLKIIVHPKSYLHALVKFNNGLIKILIHDTNMKIPIFNSLYTNTKKTIKSKELNLNILNNLDLKFIDKKRFPLIGILDNLNNNDTLYETVIVSANDCLVNLFLDDKIKFTDISKILLYILNMSEFNKYKKIIPKNIMDITRLSNYVSLKISNMSI